MSEQSPRFYEFGDFRIDIAERQLQRGGKVVSLMLKTFEVLLALVENRSRILDKERLLDAVWPDSFVEEANLARHISALRQALGDTRDEPHFIETIPKRGYRFIADVREVSVEPNTRSEETSLESRKLIVPKERIEPVGGAVPLDSQFYIVRPIDDEFHSAIARRDSIVLVKGARQMGKTSLLARGLQRAREAGVAVVFTDLQTLSDADLENAESLFLTLGELIAEQLELDVPPGSIWNPKIGSNINFERYIKREALKKTAGPLVWGLDEVDRLFTFDFASEVFGLFRSWHNLRSFEPMGPWQNLTLAISYATEAHLFIKDINQSPFNVGTRLQLDDFTLEQVDELNRRYGSPLRDRAELERLYNLVGGHPYLVRKSLFELAQGMEFAFLESEADRDDGPLGDHLRRILGKLEKDPAICGVMRGVLDGEACPNLESFYRLRSAGLIVGDSVSEPMPRCRLYANYLKRHLK
jgi:DNA-binding winged helix-turn-helix (wHTH) protein